MRDMNINLTDGRVGRFHWLLSFIYTSATIGVMDEFLSFMIYNSDNTSINISIMVILFMIMIGVALMQIFINIRRLHDINRSGWFILALFIPIIQIIMLLILLFSPGTTGDNKYGKKPHRLAPIIPVIFGSYIPK